MGNLAVGPLDAATKEGKMRITPQGRYGVSLLRRVRPDFTILSRRRSHEGSIPIDVLAGSDYGMWR